MNATGTDRVHGVHVNPSRHRRDDIGERLVLVAGAEIAFAVLVDLVTGTPPAFATTLVFGLALAIGLAWHTHHARLT